MMINNERFEEIVDNMLEHCKSTLCKKADEYSTEEDRLHNFKCAGGYLGRNPKDALLGMMTKHLVSISDMCQSDRSYPVSMWDEKIGDVIDYLLLLRGLVEEEKENYETGPLFSLGDPQTFTFTCQVDPESFKEVLK